MLEVLKKDIMFRTNEDIFILEKATSYLSFFAKINSKKLNVERKIHYKCCRRLRYQSAKKGSLVIKLGKYF